MPKPAQLKALLEKMGATDIDIGPWHVCFDFKGEEVELSATKAKGKAEIEIFIQPEVESKSISG